MAQVKKWERSEVAIKLICEAISELRDELALLNSTIARVEALAEDPPRRARPRKVKLSPPFTDEIQR